ncbi:MAG: ATP-binding protein [Clostridia bacterium]|nr:ATP-binding protein [Clostridia bacterium]
MLVEFKTKNYKSFADEAIFSLSAAPKQKGLDYSIYEKKIKDKKIKTLCSSIIYGPNAAGKTNIIGAMDTFRSIILRGNIKNAEEGSSPNAAAHLLELIPNNTVEGSEPVLFSIDFMEKDMLIHYAVSLDLGSFLDDDCPRKILKEELFVNDEKVFARDETLSFGDFKVIEDYLTDITHQNEESLMKISINSLNDEELFLMNGFKLIFSQDFVKLINEWFDNKFMVVYRADSMQLIKRFVDPQKQTVYVERTTNNAAKLFGINSNDLGYIVSEDDSDIRLCSIFNNIKDKKSAAMTAEIFESYGTIRFINIFPLVIRAILTGGTLIVDEFDASIHPMALMSIVNIFHNDDINKHQAQLIFNTHNPIFLNSNLFRRDEIKFVERDEESQNSVLYSLSDFGTKGDKGVRKHDDYMKHYFVGQYGAIKDIDFTPIFEELISDEREV